MKRLFSPAPVWQPGGIALIRIVVALFMIYHGWEVFDAEKMKTYLTVYASHPESFRDTPTKSISICVSRLLLSTLLLRWICH